MKTKTIDIGKDFSEVPGGRFPEDGPFNGELFRQSHLVPALRAYDRVEVVLDNTEGFGSSFLDEAFGGLVRKEGLAREILQERLILIAKKSTSAKYKRKIESYILKSRPEHKVG